MQDYINTPQAFFVEVTSSCNFNCAFCEYHKDPGFHLTKAQFTSRFSLLNYFPKKIVLTGGEPFLNPEIIFIIDYLIENEIWHSIYTNGVILSNDILNALKDDPYLINLNISIHSHNKLEYEALTNTKGSYDILIRNLKKLNKAQIPFSTNCVITNTIPSNINKLVNFSLEQGAKLVGFTKLQSSSKQNSKLSPSKKRLYFLLNEIKESGYSKFVDFDCFQYCEAGSLSVNCFAGCAFFNIKVNGDITPCIYSNYVFGNIYSDTFRNLWNSKNAQHWRNLFSQECSVCTRKNICFSGCKNSLQAKTNSSYAPVILHDKTLDNIKIEPFDKVIPRFHIVKANSSIFIVRFKNIRQYSTNFLPFMDYLITKPTISKIRSRFSKGYINTIKELLLDDFVYLK